jgi:hypothetical protein
LDVVLMPETLPYARVFANLTIPDEDRDADPDLQIRMGQCCLNPGAKQNFRESRTARY